MKKILMVVDYQNDFANPDGILYVPGGENLWQNIQKRIDSTEYDKTIYTFDTHQKTEYQTSSEAELFPIHCEFGTKGWDLFKIKPKENDWDKLKSISTQNGTPFEQFIGETEAFFTKNVFNIWDGNEIYPKWFEDNFDKEDFEIDVVGLATNYCVFMNVMGLVKRGFKVNIIEDCVAGITNFPDGTEDITYNQNIIAMKDSGVIFK